MAPRASDPLHERVKDAVYVACAAVAGLLAEAIEDGARRIVAAWRAAHPRP